MLPPILVGHSRLPQTSPQPILHLIHLVGDDSFVCYSSSVDRYGSVVWSLSSPFFWGCDAIVSLTPPPLLLITYHPLPLYSAALVLSFSLILTTSHLSVLHPLPYSLKQFLDLTPSLGIAVPPGIVLRRYE